MEDGIQCQQSEVTSQTARIREGRTDLLLVAGGGSHPPACLAVTGKTEGAPMSGSTQGLGFCFASFLIGQGLCIGE